MDSDTFDAFDVALTDRIENLTNLVNDEHIGIDDGLRKQLRQELFYTQNALDYLHNNYTRGE